MLYCILVQYTEFLYEANINGELNYRGITVADGVAHVEQHYTVDEIKQVTCFSDLHELLDANMTLPFPEDCGNTSWLNFSNAVIAAFDLKIKHRNAKEDEFKGKH